jgi:WG containing repeat
LGAVVATAQVGNDYLFMIRDGRKFGFINRSGAVVVPPKFDAVGDMHEGRIQVSVGSLSGYIDLSGKVVIEPKYESAGDFRDSRAIVRIGDKYSLIDPSGKPIGDIPYRVLGDFHQGLLRVQASNLVDSNGKKLPTRYGFVDLQGKIVIPPKFLPAGEFPDDPADLPVAGLDNDWCYFDRTGKVVIRIPMGPHLNDADLFVNGRLRVKDGFNWGYKDASGGWAISPKYNDAQNFRDGFASVQNGDKWIAIDVRGNPAPQDKKKIRAIGPYSEGLALAADNGLLGWIDAQEHLAFPLRKYQEAFKFSGGLARFKLDDLYGYLDKSGKMAIVNQYESAEDFDHGLARVQTRSGYAYIDARGTIVWKSGKP